MKAKAKYQLITKALRVLLVFTLVFWSSLGVEWAIAFGADGDSSETSADAQQPVQAEQPETPGTIEEPTQPEQPEEPDTPEMPDQPINPGGSESPDTPESPDNPENPGAEPEPEPESEEFTEEERFDASKHKDGTLVGIEVWSLDVKDPGAEYADGLIRTLRQTVDEQGYQTPKMSTLDGVLSVIAVPIWSADSDLSDTWKPKALKADFLKWSVMGNDGYAEVSTDGGVLTVRSLSEGSFLVACTVDDGKNEKGEQVGTDYTDLIYEDFSKDHPGKNFSVMFSVEVLGPYVDIELLQSDGTTCAGLESLSLSAEQLKSYAFQANVRVYDQVNEGAIDEFHCTSTLGLREASSAKYGESFGDLTWQVLDADRNQVDGNIATISDMGVLEFKGDIDKDGPVIVRVSSPNGFNQNMASAEVVIGNWAEDPQGESHPQDTLRITSNARMQDEGSNEPVANPSDAAEENEPESELENEPENEPESELENEDAGSETGEETDDVQKANAIDKIYTVAQVEALGKSTATFTMQGTDGSISIKGEGVSLEVLLADAGITDLTQVNSIEFIDYTGASTTVSWADISSGTQGPFIAVRSRVLSNGSETGGPSAASAEADDGELLDNTRFRLLFYGSSSVDPNALRWIRHIHVNVDAGDGGGEESDLAVHVDYVPVPRGKQAVLSAIPTQAIGSARFGFSWETSADGEDWTAIPDGEVQTLRLMTDDEHIGRWYRVVLNTDLTDPQTGEAISATSKAVQIEEGSGFMAILAYDPPIAGQTAIFQSSVEAFVDGQQISIDPAQLKYEWQKSEDGGASWQRIEGATGPSFAVPTEPIVESEQTADVGDGEDESTENPTQEPEPITLIYVRVVVTTTDVRIPEAGRVTESNAQPLTVRVGGGDDPFEDNNGTNDEEDQQGAAPQLPTDEQPPAEQTPTPSTPASIGGMTEVTSIRVDNAPRSEVPTAVTTEPTAQQPAAQQQSAATVPAQELKPDELLINPEITALVQEQEAAVDKAVTNSRPGARWTQLSTVEPTNEDVRRILAENPFAPFAIPLGLGIAVAGGLEKLIAFRREID